MLVPCVHSVHRGVNEWPLSSDSLLWQTRVWEKYEMGVGKCLSGLPSGRNSSRPLRVIGLRQVPQLGGIERNGLRYDKESARAFIGLSGFSGVHTHT